MNIAVCRPGDRLSANERRRFGRVPVYRIGIELDADILNRHLAEIDRNAESPAIPILDDVRGAKMQARPAPPKALFPGRHALRGLGCQLPARCAEPSDRTLLIEQRQQFADSRVDLGKVVKSPATKPPEEPSLDDEHRLLDLRLGECGQLPVVWERSAERCMSPIRSIR